MMSGDLVVNISSGQSYDVYIGRGRCPVSGVPSIWGNPFRIGQDGTRDEVIEKYLAYVLADSRLIAQVSSLAGLRLGCWCRPSRCHGDVLVDLSASMREKESDPR